MSNKLVLRLENSVDVEPLTENQALFMSSYGGFDVHLLHGVAGTGKTFLAVYKGLEDVLDKNTPYKTLIIVRSAVPSRDIGFLPGDEEEKSLVYQLPYMQICKDLLNSKDAYDRLKEHKVVQFTLSSFIRGMTFDNCVVVVDEMQNLNYQELYTIITRIGIESKVIFCGDTRQVDLNTKKDLDKFMKVLHTMPSVSHVEFNVEDIVRSDIVKEFIIAEEELYGQG